jgi:hypothetical protein
LLDSKPAVFETIFGFGAILTEYYHASLARIGRGRRCLLLWGVGAVEVAAGIMVVPSGLR